MNKSALKDLMRIPGVGKSIAQDLIDIGINSVEDLKGKNPEQLYVDSCKLAGGPIDRCLLYVYRCAVYYASHKSHKPELLLWWNWKDK
jgi:hypothetical protein